ncbi:MAG: response regulator [Deltaproteobacteria bacterium]|nr:response regulator [Deltaproteobacteria bacterium]
MFLDERNVIFRSASNLEAGLKLADTFRPTVLLLTADSPLGIEPEDVIVRLREHPSTSKLPILVLVEEHGRRRYQFLTAGASECLELFVSVDVLRDCVRFHSLRFLRSRRRENRDGLTEELAVNPVRVLMVDDSRATCRSFAAKLEQEEDVVFDYCNDPTQAMTSARAFMPTVILLDLEMPKMSGFELLAIFRQEASLEGVPIIVLSGLTDSEYKVRAFRNGANDYAEKQIDQVELISRIRYHSKAYMSIRRLDESIQELMKTQKQLKQQRDFVRKTFGRYLSDEVVTGILETPEGLKLGGESRVISMLMSDLRGFTSMSEQFSPETVLAIINNYLEAMTEVVLRYNGTIDEFIGDAILAVFGAPVLRKDDALRAVACAVEMQRSMAEVNQWNREHDYPDIGMGIGVHTGEVVVGNIGSERRAKYGIVGRNVNLTSRVESYTVGGQILITSNTRDACDGLLTIEKELEVSPKGVVGPITLHDIRGVGGRYALSLPQDTVEALKTLGTSIDVVFCRVVGSDVCKEMRTAQMIELSGEMALISSDAGIPSLLSNVCIVLNQSEELASERIYGKVLEIDPQTRSFLVQFTAMSPAMKTCIQGLVAEG